MNQWELPIDLDREPTLTETLDSVVHAFNQIRNTKLRSNHFKDTYQLVRWVQHYAEACRANGGKL